MRTRGVILIVVIVVIICVVGLLTTMLITSPLRGATALKQRTYIVIEYKPFFPSYGPSSEAVPLTAYWSNTSAIIEQEALWLSWAGVDAVLIDWSPATMVQDISQINWLYIDHTTQLLEVYHEMDLAHLPHPKVIILIGIDNGPHRASAQVLNYILNWVYTHYVNNPDLNTSLFYYNGKPTLIMLDGSFTNHTFRDPRFTIFFMGFHLENIMNAPPSKPYHDNPWCYWSWMDGVLTPIIVYCNESPLAVTVSTAFFPDIKPNDVGWTAPGAVGRENGATLIQEWVIPMIYRPKFIIINDWNQFSGECLHPTGPYLDQYSPEYSQDIEPTFLNSTGCMGKWQGGWGYYYLVLLKALIMLYRGETPNATIIAIAQPLNNYTVYTHQPSMLNTTNYIVLNGYTMLIRWTYVGKAPSSFTVVLDGKVIATNLTSTWYMLDLYGLPKGWHTIRILANGAVTYFNLTEAYYELVNASNTPLPCEAEVSFYYAG